MTPSKELEELQNRRAKLEEESSQLIEKQENLGERVQILEEELNIRTLEEQNRAKMDAIKDLETKISELEEKMKSPLPPPEEVKPEPAAVTAPEKPSEDAQTVTEEEPTEDYVEIAPVEDISTPPLETIEDSPKKQHEKKKRKFF